MHKPTLLRGALAASLPDLARDPDRLIIWVETGKVCATMSPARHFRWQYTLNVLVTDSTVEPAVLAVIVNEWLRVNQPDVLQTSAGYGFEAELMDRGGWDVQFTLPLDESVQVTARVGGGWDIDYPAEADPLFPDDDQLGILHEIWRDGGPAADERIVPLPESSVPD